MRARRRLDEVLGPACLEGRPEVGQPRIGVGRHVGESRAACTRHNQHSRGRGPQMSVHAPSSDGPRPPRGRPRVASGSTPSRRGSRQPRRPSSCVRTGAVAAPNRMAPHECEPPAGQAHPRRHRGELGVGMGGAGHLPLRPHQVARRGLLHRHSAAHGQRLAARRSRLLVHPHRLHRALQAHARLRGVLPDGLGRQRPAHRASRAELLRRALRSEPAVRPGVRAAGRARRQAPGPDLAEELRRAVRAADRRGRGRLRGAVAPHGPVRSTGRRRTRRSTPTPSASASSRSCATSPAARRTSPRRPPCGTSPSAPPSRRPSSRTASAPARTTASASRPRPTRPRRSSSRPRGPSCSRPASPSSRTPTTSATSRCSARRSPRPAFGVEVPVVAHTLADPEKGSGIAMICTFGDLTDVTWWRELQLPTRPIIGWDGRILPDVPEWITTDAGRENYALIAGATSHTAKERMVEILTTSGDLVGEPKPITHPVKFFEKGDKPLEIVTTRQWYITNGGREPGLRAELLERGRELQLAPPAHAGALRELGRGPQRRLADLTAALLRRAAAAVVPARRRRQPRLRLPDRAGRGHPADRPEQRRPARLRRRTSAACPAASWATPTSWTPGPRAR